MRGSRSDVDRSVAARRTGGRPRRSANQASRLSGERAFKAVFRHGVRTEGRYVQIVVAEASVPLNGAVGFVLSGKLVRRAVDRNRFKRVMRETLRGCRDALRGVDLIIRVKRLLPTQAVDEATREAGELVSQALLHERPYSTAR